MKNIKKIILIIMLITISFIVGKISSINTSTSNSKSESHIHNAKKSTTWTCSMHPQIKLPKKGKCPICFMDLIPLERNSNNESETEIIISKSAQKLAEIQTAIVVKKNVSKEIRMSGKVTYDESRVKIISSRISGRIEKLFVDYTGIKVKNGENMLEIYSPELYAAQEELIQSLRLGDNESNTLLKASREKLFLWGLSKKQIKTIEKNKKAKDRITIYSPISGIVVHKNATEGAYISTGTRLYTVADLSKVWVKLEAYESDISWIRVGQKVELTTTSLPGEIFSGKVSFIDPILDPATRTIKVRVNVNNKSLKLKPDMFITGILLAKLSANGNIITKFSNKTKTLVIPTSAPLITGKRAIVYIATKKNNKTAFEGKEINLGHKVGEFYVVKSGLKEGDKIVTNGTFKIDAEMQIQAKPSMMSMKSEKKKTNKPLRILKELESIYKPYLKVQKALASDNFIEAKKSMNALNITAKKIKSKMFLGKEGKSFLSIIVEIHSGLKHLEHTNDISSLRVLFGPLSSKIIELEKNFGHLSSKTNKNIVIAYCPMAFNNKGGSWIQQGKEINNPFYGASMLRCGEVKQELKGR